MTLFDNGDPEEFLLVVRNFKMTLEASGTLTSNKKFNIDVIYYVVRHYMNEKLYVPILEA